MAMPQRDNVIEEIKRLEPPPRIRFGASSALLEYAVQHGDEAEAARLPLPLPEDDDALLPVDGVYVFPRGDGKAIVIVPRTSDAARFFRVKGRSP